MTEQFRNDSSHPSLYREIADLDIIDPLSPRVDRGAWEILRNFATSEMTLPNAEEHLKKQLGDRYNERDWRPALDAVMNAEGDVMQAQEALHKLAAECRLPRLTIRLPPQSRPAIPQIIEAEQELMDSVKKLVERNRIIGPPPTLEDLVDPVEEREVGDSPYRFEGGDDEIMAEVRREMAIAQGDIIEVDDSDLDSEEDMEDVPSRGEVIKLCEVLEKVCLRYGDADFSLELPRQLRKYRTKLRRDNLLNSTQTSIDNFFTQNTH